MYDFILALMKVIEFAFNPKIQWALSSNWILPDMEKLNEVVEIVSIGAKLVS